MSFIVRDLRLQDYLPTVDLQKQILEGVISGEQPDTLLLVEHPPVLTLGVNFHPDNLLHEKDWYAFHGLELFTTDRGGEVTYHGPGQLVAYPIFSLEERGKDLHAWLRALEAATIETLSHFGIAGVRFPPNTGVWVGDRKICAMGIKVRKWVSMHGLALNCNNDLAPFEWIVPCGIKEFGVTSLTEETGREVTTDWVKPILIECFRARFD